MSLVHCGAHLYLRRVRSGRIFFDPAVENRTLRS